MKRYLDYKNKNSKHDDLTEEELNSVKWTKYKIIVPSEEDKKELEMAFEHIHYSDIDTEYVTVNQLAHEYLTPEITEDPKTKNNIIVNKYLYNSLEND
jgi:hypothetical protein